MNRGRYTSSPSKIFLTIVNLCIVAIACAIVCLAAYPPINPTDGLSSVAWASMYRADQFIITRRLRAGPAQITLIRLAAVIFCVRSGAWNHRTGP